MVVAGVCHASIKLFIFMAQFSTFGGHPLTRQDGDTIVAAEAFSANADAVGTLATTFGIEDAEQLVAIAAIPGLLDNLASTLGVDYDQVAALVEQAKSTLPAQRLTEIETPVLANLELGALMPTDEMMAAAEASATTEAMTAGMEAVALPSLVNLVPFMSAIRSQASRGTCVAFTLTALNEYALRRRGIVQDLSEQHLYYETKLIDGSPTLCGTWQSQAVLPLASRGQCEEVIWPYNPNPPCNNHGPLPPLARPRGLAYRLNTIAVPARNVDVYKRYLAIQRPVTLSFPVYRSWYRSAETARTGRITMPIAGDVQEGGHAVCLVGYVDTASSPGGGYFIVRNSWGTGWASASPFGAGYGTIPYQYITNLANEAYTTAQAFGVGEADEQAQQAGASTVTIEVKPTITITITSH